MSGKLADTAGRSVADHDDDKTAFEVTPSRYALFSILYGLAMVLVLVLTYCFSGADYVGQDNDDVMRLIEVRDLLGGQGWFDMTQYRLGLDGGTLMHWSRFIDLPIALLIRFFALFAAPERAEALALAVWPLSLAFAIVCLMGVAARRAAGPMAFHIASGMTIFYVMGMGRFGVGSIDHHNAQLTLAALVLAMIADPLKRPSNFATAGLAAAMGLAIGAESAPFVAGVCMVMALLWAVTGKPVARPVAAFSFAFVLTITAAFFLTTPPHLYRMVTCDNLSLGFYTLASIGGFLLFLQTMFLGNAPRQTRFMSLAATGAVVLVSAKIIAPQCLGNPLAELDPMLTELWLNKVTEARSFTAQLAADPSTVAGFYAVGFLSLLVCLFRILRRDRAEPHAIWLTLCAIAFAVSLVQVRGAMFANLLAILPMALLLTDLRRWQQAAPNHAGRAIAYFGAVLASLPLVWAVAGLMASQGTRGLVAQAAGPARTNNAGDCSSATALAPLAGLPKGVVMAPSDMGVHILRYTAHRVLSAPYHRDQGGMLTELNAGLSLPEEAIAFLRGAKVNYLAFCPTEVQTRSLAAMKPDGFYASLLAGNVPAYLELVKAADASGLEIFKVKTP